MKLLLSDFRLGVRTLTSNSGLTAAAVAALAIGVGASSAIFSLVDAVLLWPPPRRDPGELVSARSTSLDEQRAFDTTSPWDCVSIEMRSTESARCPACKL
jgi:hypothetical protein